MEIGTCMDEMNAEDLRNYPGAWAVCLLVDLPDPESQRTTEKLLACTMFCNIT
jgi:hypothetical protein